MNSTFVCQRPLGAWMGRLRMRRVRDASAASLVPFVEESVEAGAVVHTDGWLSCEPLEKKGYRHRIVFLSGRSKQASELLPRVHRHQPDQVLVGGEHAGLEALQSRGQRRAAISVLLRAEQAEGRIGGHPHGVVEILVARQARVD